MTECWEAFLKYLIKCEINYLDVLSAIVAVFAFILSVRATRLSHAAVESQIYDMILNSSKDVLATGDYSKNDEAEAAKYEHCNSYEFACSQFLKRRISRSQFKSLYKRDLKEIVESEAYKKVLFDEKKDCRYENILSVYYKIIPKKDRKKKQEKKTMMDVNKSGIVKFQTCKDALSTIVVPVYIYLIGFVDNLCLKITLVIVLTLIYIFIQYIFNKSISYLTDCISN